MSAWCLIENSFLFPLSAYAQPPPPNQFRCCRSWWGGVKTRSSLLPEKEWTVLKVSNESCFQINLSWLWSLLECQRSSLLALVGWCHSKTHACKWDWPADMGSPSHSQPLRRLYKEFVKVLSGPRVLFPILRFCFAGVSCDACLKGNFRGRRFKCLICYDYDLCASCYESGATTTRHTTEHPMQCILTRVDYGKDLTLWVSDYMHDRHACCTGWWYC